MPCPAAATTDGQKYGTVTAANSQGVESKRSNEFAFVIQIPVPASASTDLVVGPK